MELTQEQKDIIASEAEALVSRFDDRVSDGFPQLVEDLGYGYLADDEEKYQEIIDEVYDLLYTEIRKIMSGGTEIEAEPDIISDSKEG